MLHFLSNIITMLHLILMFRIIEKRINASLVNDMPL